MVNEASVGHLERWFGDVVKIAVRTWIRLAQDRDENYDDDDVII